MAADGRYRPASAATSGAATPGLNTVLTAAVGVGRAKVLALPDGSAFERDRLKRLMIEVQRAAGMKEDGRVHILRHTFGARLAIEGAPPKAIQELMGHSDLTTTLRYMHLTPQAATDAIRRLDTASGRVGGEQEPPALSS